MPTDETLSIMGAIVFVCSIRDDVEAAEYLVLPGVATCLPHDVLSVSKSSPVVSSNFL